MKITVLQLNIKRTGGIDLQPSRIHQDYGADYGSYNALVVPRSGITNAFTRR